MRPFVVRGMFGGILAIAAGIIVLIWPAIIAYVVGIYLIVIGILALVAEGQSRR